MWGRDARALAGGGSREPGVPRVAPCGCGLLLGRVEQDHIADAGVRLGLGVCVCGGVLNLDFWKVLSERWWRGGVSHSRLEDQLLESEDRRSGNLSLRFRSSHLEGQRSNLRLFRSQWSLLRYESRFLGGTQFGSLRTRFKA